MLTLSQRIECIIYVGAGAGRYTLVPAGMGMLNVREPRRTLTWRFDDAVVSRRSGFSRVTTAQPPPRPATFRCPPLPAPTQAQAESQAHAMAMGAPGPPGAHQGAEGWPSLADGSPQRV